MKVKIFSYNYFRIFQRVHLLQRFGSFKISRNFSVNLIQFMLQPSIVYGKMRHDVMLPSGSADFTRYFVRFDTKNTDSFLNFVGPGNVRLIHEKITFL